MLYKQFKYWLDGMFGTDSSASPHDYLAELVPTTAHQTFNLIYGQTGLTYRVNGCIIDTINIQGAINGPVTYDLHLMGKAAQTGSFSVISDDTSVVVAMGSHAKVYVDAAAGTMGATEITTTGFSFNANITCDRKLAWHLGGGLVPDGFREGKWGGSLKLTMEMTAAMKVIMDAALLQGTSPASKLVEVKLTDTLTTSVLQLRHSGHLLAAPSHFTDTDGVTTVEMTFVPVYDTVYVSCWGAILTLP